MMRPIVGGSKWANTNMKSTNTISSNFQIFPNPANERINFIIPESLELSHKQVLISDITGKILINKELTDSYIEINSLRPGIYILRIVSSDGQVFNSKFIKSQY